MFFLNVNCYNLVFYFYEVFKDKVIDVNKLNLLFYFSSFVL